MDFSFCFHKLLCKKEGFLCYIIFDDRLLSDLCPCEPSMFSSPVFFANLVPMLSDCFTLLHLYHLCEEKQITENMYIRRLVFKENNAALYLSLCLHVLFDKQQYNPVLFDTRLIYVDMQPLKICGVVSLGKPTVQYDTCLLS